MAKKIVGVTKMAAGIIARNETEMTKQRSLVSRLRGLGYRWRCLKESIRCKRYFIKTLKEVGILRFGDRFRIMFAKDIGRIQMEVIDRLTKVYEKAFFSMGVQKRSSVIGTGTPPDYPLEETARDWQDMLEGNRSLD